MGVIWERFPKFVLGLLAEGRSRDEILKAYPNIKGFQGSASTDVAGIGQAIEEAGLQDQLTDRAAAGDGFLGDPCTVVVPDVRVESGDDDRVLPDQLVGPLPDRGEFRWQFRVQ